MLEQVIIVKLKVIIISPIVRICLIVTVKRVCDVTRISCTLGRILFACINISPTLTSKSVIYYKLIKN